MLKKSSDPQELELQVIVNSWIWGPENQAQLPFETQQILFIVEPSL